MEFLLLQAPDVAIAEASVGVVLTTVLYIVALRKVKAVSYTHLQTDVLVERVCGICSHSHAMTYAMCVEHIAGMEVTKRGQYIRVLISELERIHSHLLWLGLLADAFGFESLFYQCWRMREKILDLFESVSYTHLV